MKELDFWVNFVSNLLTILASGIGIYLFVFNKDKIKNALNVLLNYSNQLTLNELKYKIERLNDYNAGDINQKNEVINILNEIEGQIIGNDALKIKLANQLGKISVFINNNRLLSEAKKRSLVSELRESLRNLDVSNFNNIVNPSN